MTTDTNHLAQAAAAYSDARAEAERILTEPRSDLTAAVRDAYQDGMRKADILRAIDHIWSRQWLDDLLRDLPAPPRPVGRRRRAR